MRYEMTPRHKLTALIGAAVVATATSIGAISALLPDASAQVPSHVESQTSASSADVLAQDVTPDILGYASCIVAAATDLGLGADAQLIGITTAWGESGLRVLDHGDDAGPDSRGLFQQRENGAWGSLDDRMDPYRSAENFFLALEDVDGWQTMTPSEAAHEVQHNTDPDHYTSSVPFAKVVLERVDRDGATCSDE